MQIVKRIHARTRRVEAGHAVGRVVAIPGMEKDRISPRLTGPIV